MTLKSPLHFLLSAQKKKKHYINKKLLGVNFRQALERSFLVNAFSVQKAIALLAFRKALNYTPSAFKFLTIPNR